MHFFDILNTPFKIEKRGSAPRFPPPPRDVFKIRGALFLRAAPPMCSKSPGPTPAPKKPPRGGPAPIAPGAYFPAFAARAARAFSRRSAFLRRCSSVRTLDALTFTAPFGTMKYPTWGCPPQIS